MGIVQNVVTRVGRALRPVRAGAEKLAFRKLGADRVHARLHVSSEAFRDGEALPRAASADGGSTPPVLAWSGVPAQARSIAVLCEDPDAPLPQPFVHWIVYDLPARDATLDATLLAQARQGKNTKGKSEYTGAAPPPGHGPHHYHFQVFALDAPLSLGANAGRSELLAAMRGHVLAFGQIIGAYAR